jgi:hypothetical protein
LCSAPMLSARLLQSSMHFGCGSGVIRHKNYICGSASHLWQINFAKNDSKGVFFQLSLIFFLTVSSGVLGAEQGLLLLLLLLGLLQWVLMLKLLLLLPHPTVPPARISSSFLRKKIHKLSMHIYYYARWLLPVDQR